METIKVFQRTGFAIAPEVLQGVANNRCHLAVFNSESNKEGIDRENIVKNFLQAASYRDDKDYSIIMDDDVVLTDGAIPVLVAGLKGFDIATLPVNGNYTRTQHAIIAIKNSVLDKYKIKAFNLNVCNQCIYIAHLIDKLQLRINALKNPMQKTIKRLILKKD